MQIFKPVVVVFILIALLSIFGCQTKDEAEVKPEAEKPSRIIDVSEVTTIMTVKEINLEERLFTLTYEGMNEIVVEAAEDLTGIEEIKVGDKVSVTYLASTAMYVQAPDAERPPVVESKIVEVDSKDGKPRKVKVDIIEETFTVEGIDVENRKATLKGPDGKVSTVDVHKDVQNLENVNIGDQVIMQRTESIAVDIKKVE